MQPHNGAGSCQASSRAAGGGLQPPSSLQHTSLWDLLVLKPSRLEPSPLPLGITAHPTCILPSRESLLIPAQPLQLRALELHGAHISSVGGIAQAKLCAQ